MPHPSELMGTIGRVVSRRSSLRGQTGVNVGRFLGLRTGCCGGWVGGVFFVLNTSQIATRKASGEKVLKAHSPFPECAPHTRAGFVQWLLAALGSDLHVAPFSGFFSLFHSLGWRVVAPCFSLSRTI